MILDKKMLFKDLWYLVHFKSYYHHWISKRHLIFQTLKQLWKSCHVQDYSFHQSFNEYLKSTAQYHSGNMDFCSHKADILEQKHTANKWGNLGLPHFSSITPPARIFHMPNSPTSFHTQCFFSHCSHTVLWKEYAENIIIAMVENYNENPETHTNFWFLILGSFRMVSLWSFFPPVL